MMARRAMNTLISEGIHRPDGRGRAQSEYQIFTPVYTCIPVDCLSTQTAARTRLAASVTSLVRTARAMTTGDDRRLTAGMEPTARTIEQFVTPDREGDWRLGIADRFRSLDGEQVVRY
jgi:hypothetical protein